MATWQEQQVAQQELSRLAGAPSQGTRITNEAQAAASGSAHPSQAMQGVQTGPGWANYLAGIQQVQQARPDQGGALPVQGGTPTLARQQFEESIRQFNAQMAHKRAVLAAQQAAQARAARTADSPDVEFDEQSALWSHLRGVVDDALSKGQDWSQVRGYLTSEYGNISSIMPFEEAEKAAFTYYDQAKHPQAQPWHTAPPEPESGSTWYKPWTWGKEPEPMQTDPEEDIDRLRRAFYGDRYEEEF